MGSRRRIVALHGDTRAGTGTGPLDWDEFNRDLIVASHFSKHIGVYDLEGCVRQGFLLRLKDMDWSASVTIPARSISRAKRFGLILRMVLWIGSNPPYLILAVFLFLLFWRFAAGGSGNR
jgi:sterol desaturase/sphingolipid hydroxylase (fatty acid hydroxylase superfamily)